MTRSRRPGSRPAGPDRPTDASRPDAARPDAARPDAARPDASRNDAPHPDASRPDAAARRARVGVALLFLTNGALFANILPRYPEIKADLELSNTLYGFAVVAYPVGAILAGLAAGALVRRFRSARVAVVGTVATGSALVVAALAPAWAPLAAALLLAGAADAITDVAQNSHGLRVQRRFGRSIINSFHALWSVGAVLGGLLGGAAAAVELPRAVHLGLSGALFVVVALVAGHLLLPGPEPRHASDYAGPVPQAAGTAAGGPGGAGTDAVAGGVDAATTPSGAAPRTPFRLGVVALLVAFVVIGASGTLVEDAGMSWAAVYLSGSFGTSAGVASLGLVALVGAQFVGRLVGDRLVDRFGQRAVARVGGVLVLTGFGAALAFPSVPGTIAGFAAAGLGVATLVPAAMQGADELPGLRHGTGLTLVSWLMRLGFLLSPLVGAVADAVDLRTGLLVVPVSGLLVVVLSQALAGRRALR